MKILAITSADDIKDFFNAYNNHNWKIIFNYMSNDCVWDASEKRLEGRSNIINYWTKYHSAFKEKLGKPENIVFSDNKVYLQVKVHLDFLEDGVFFGKSYKKGETLYFTCADYYELNDEGRIKLGTIYIKFVNSQVK